MLTSLSIKNFRSLENLEVKSLGNVNLIVGKNNSGKSSILEALRIFASSGDFAVLQNIASERNEPMQAVPDENANNLKPMESFFTDRTYYESDNFTVKSIKIGDGHSTNLAIQPINLEEELNRLLIESNPQGVNPSAIHSNPQLLWHIQQYQEVLYAFSVTTPDGNMRLSFQKNGGVSYQGQVVSVRKLGFVPTKVLDTNELISALSEILATPDEDALLETLQVLEPLIERFSVVDIKQNGHLIGQRAVMLRMKGYAQRIPLKSLGDGVGRIFQIMLNALVAKNGVLLIDEFENGLHFSVQEKVWNLIFNLSTQFNIQVFATTHSWDCIESFAKVAKERKEEGVLFRLERSVMPDNEGKIVAIEYSEDELLTMTKANFEVR